MTRVRLEPTYKKSTVEIEFFKDDNNTWVHVETGWRWGAFYADVTDEELVELHDHNRYCEENSKYDEFEISALTDFECDHTWDGCWMDFRVWNNNWTEEQREELREEIENSGDYFEWLEERGFVPQDMETYICGQIDIQLEGENDDENTLPKETG